MSDDTPIPKFESLLTPRLLAGTPLLNTPEQDKWRIIAETIEAMRKLFFRIHLNTFDQAAAEVFDTDLGLIMEAMDQSPDDVDAYDGVTEAMRALGTCRSQVNNVAHYYDKGTAEHLAATQAMMDLQATMKDALEYINPICENLNPGPDQANNFITS